jgi:hypothetical protein
VSIKITTIYLNPFISSNKFDNSISRKTGEDIAFGDSTDSGPRISRDRRKTKKLGEI